MYLSAYARQPARGPTMLAHLVAMVASCWPMLSQKIRKIGTGKNHCKTQDILMVGGLSWGHVGPSWGYVYLEGNVGPSWGYVGPSWGYVGPSWGYGAPSWGYVGPSWGYVAPSWGLCWPIRRPMLVHLAACRIWSHEGRKRGNMERARNTVKRGGFWPDGVGLGFGGGGLGLVGRGLRVRVWGLCFRVGATLPQLDGNVGPSWGYVGPVRTSSG